jgi:hypothetical protein
MEKDHDKLESETEKRTPEPIPDEIDNDFILLDELLNHQFLGLDLNKVKVIFNGYYSLYTDNLISSEFLGCMKKGLNILNIVSDEKDYLKKNSHLTIVELNPSNTKQTVLFQIRANNKLYLINGIGVKNNGAKLFRCSPDKCVYLKSNSKSIAHVNKKKYDDELSYELREFRRKQLEDHDGMLKVIKRLKMDHNMVEDCMTTKQLKKIFFS